MTSTSHIFLVGASRGVGKEIANYLSKQNIQVTALVRNETSRAELEAMGVEVVVGDALNIDDLESSIITDKPIHAVISTLGGLPTDQEKPDYLGNKNIIDAAVKAGVEKFVLVTSIGTGNSVGALSPQALNALQTVLVEKDKAEQHLIASGLIYTIIRPGGLKSEPATGNGVLTEDTRIVGSIHRADVAELVCRCLSSESANNKILSAIDKKMLFTQTEFVEFKLD
ncbi:MULTISPECIES: SDR family oxidoreductase [unclassified Anabaena]|uniref:SDR family oxidoreductase n=1 Tax=unclassified Anabaena TaxID=2619674 RepID=UPI002B1F653F|nr:SDR family oxidoreductase [Anabaena sp. UHCC 0399]MEA5566134.1 SDR family oxidoreductase [Anabaena sp. UHCC 0399]